MRQFSALQQRMLNDFQHDFPLSPTPYADMAKALGVYETTVLENLKRLQSEGVVSRVGAVFRPNRVGVSTLAAMAVDESELDEIASIVNEFTEVNHNYQREHRFNLWFVVVAADQQGIDDTLKAIEDLCGYQVLDLPMLEDYFIDLGFDLKWR